MPMPMDAFMPVQSMEPSRDLALVVCIVPDAITRHRGMPRGVIFQPTADWKPEDMKITTVDKARRMHTRFLMDCRAAGTK